MKAKEFIPASKPRNLVAKNTPTTGAGAHRDKKKEQKQGYEKHKGKMEEGETALEKFRKAAAEREKKHSDAEKEMKARHASGKEDMKGAIDRLEKHLDKK